MMLATDFSNVVVWSSYDLLKACDVYCSMLTEFFCLFIISSLVRWPCYATIVIICVCEKIRSECWSFASSVICIQIACLHAFSVLCPCVLILCKATGFSVSKLCLQILWTTFSILCVKYPGSVNPLSTAITFWLNKIM